MALLDLPALKRYLRVSTTLQDTLLTEILAQATALVRAYLNQPITAAEQTAYLTVGARNGLGTLYLPSYPSAAGVTITDPDDTAIDAADYRVDRYAGALVGLDSYSFAYGTHTVTGTWGLSEHPDYAALIEPIINAGIRDYASDLYHRREPAAGYVTAGAGVSTTYNEFTNQGGLPPRILTTLAPWRRRNV